MITPDSNHHLENCSYKGQSTDFLPSIYPIKLNDTWYYSTDRFRLIFNLPILLQTNLLVMNRFYKSDVLFQGCLGSWKEKTEP